LKIACASWSTRCSRWRYWWREGSYYRPERVLIVDAVVLHKTKVQRSRAISEVLGQDGVDQGSEIRTPERPDVGKAFATKNVIDTSRSLQEVRRTVTL